MSIKARTSRRQCSAQRVSVRFTAASALAVACGLASAQSGVTLYGRVAGGIDYTNKIDTGSSQSAGRLQYGSNQWGTSMWGLRASEDLGGGLKAVMNLENGFTSADGVASGGLFNRYAVAGLSSSTYGTLLVGRAMGIPDSEVYTIDPMGLQFMSAATFQGNRTWGSRTKAITYNSPVWGGWSFRAQAGLNGTAGNFNAGRQLAASIGYQNGPLMLKDSTKTSVTARGNSPISTRHPAYIPRAGPIKSAMPSCSADTARSSPAATRSRMPTTRPARRGSRPTGSGPTTR